MRASFSLTFPANCLGSRCIVMRISLLEDVIRASHIVRDVLMIAKTSASSELPGFWLVRLMHMGERPRAAWRGADQEIGPRGQLDETVEIAIGGSGDRCPVVIADLHVEAARRTLRNPAPDFSEP